VFESASAARHGKCIADLRAATCRPPADEPQGRHVYKLGEGAVMPLIEWDDSFSVGFAEIDSQHHRWIQMINDLDEVLSKGEVDRFTTAMQASLDAMTDYARFHFDFEERFMADLGYPEIEAHQKTHRRLIGQLTQIQDDIKRGYRPLNTQLMSIMMNWLKDHILEEDKQFGPT
jgi:hemerythrin